MPIAPIPWNPSTASQPGSDILGKMLGSVQSGDWIQVLVSYRSSNKGGGFVAYATNNFLIHVVYTPDSDDAIPHEDQSTTYGGSSTAGNRRRNYRIDPAWAFQVPWNGQISIIAGGDSDPDIMVDVLLVRGFTPRDGALQMQMAHVAQVETMERAMSGDFRALVQLQNPRIPQAPRIYAPPVVGVPQLVPSTWIDITSGTAIPFPDGAVQIIAVTNPGAGERLRLTCAVMGNTLNLDIASGRPSSIGTFGQGNACTDGVSATWTPTADIETVTIWSSIGG